jgi:hypothetical protein
MKQEYCSLQSEGKGGKRNIGGGPSFFYKSSLETADRAGG